MMMLRKLMMAAITVSIAVAGCTDNRPPVDEATSRGTLAGGAASLGELAEGIVDAVSASDTAALNSFRLTEHEHNEILWPEFPTAQDAEHPFPIDLAWENIETRNAAGLDKILARVGGEPLRVAGVSCPGEEQRYPSFEVLRDCRVTVVRPSGEYAELQLFRSVVVRDGQFKIVRYEREL